MKKIAIYQSFEEQHEAEIEFSASLSLPERLNLFFKLIKLSKSFQHTLNQKKVLERKIEIKYDNRFW